MKCGEFVETIQNGEKSMPGSTLTQYRWIFAGFILSVLASAGWSAENIFYVAPDGKDVWSGRLAFPAVDGKDGPLATLTGARDRIRQLKAKGSTAGPIEVQIRNGVYVITEPLRLGFEDSGTVQSPITYRAYEREKPILSGGRPITGWRQEGNLWVVHLPEVENGKWWFSALFVDGEYHGPARAPNESFFHTAGKPQDDDKSFYYRTEELGAYADFNDAVLVVIDSWDTSHLRIAQVDEQNKIIRFTAKPNNPFEKWRPGQSYFVKNVRGAMDQPGEWCLERKTGILYYWPLPGQTMEKTKMIAPAASRLVEIQGRVDMPVERIHFAGLRFYHTEFTVPQAGFFPQQAASEVRGAIYAEFARNCSISDCEIAHGSHYGIELNKGCRYNRIVRNHIYDLGAGGVRIGPQSRIGFTELEETVFNTVDNNWIHDCGKIFLEGVGIWIGHSSFNTVSHNEICDLDYTGISVGWTWGYDPSNAHHNTIEYNHIHHIGKNVLHDMGAIYSLGVAPGTVLRNNLIHDTGIESRGIYTDEASSDMLIENNIVYNTLDAGLLQNAGRETHYINNIFAFSHIGELSIGRAEEHISLFFERNIVYVNNGLIFRQLLARSWQESRFYINQNCYWDASGRGIDFPCRGGTLEQWQQNGHDQDSLIADPLFVDAAKGDFRLRPESPAIQKLGFRPINVEEIGLYGSREWVESARQVSPAPRSLPKPPEDQPVVIDFESMPAGSVPDETYRVSNSNYMIFRPDNGGDQPGVGVYVTDLNACGGKQSMVFQDSPELKPAYSPWILLKPHYRCGILKATFDILLEPEFILHHQWRDDQHPYQVGVDIYIAGDGRLWVNPDRDFLKKLQTGQAAEPLATVPQNQWYHLEIQSGLGHQATGNFTLVITDKSGQSRRFEGLPFRDQGFRRLDWYSFYSAAKTKTACYLDNLNLTVQVDR
jgi:hypothetical protein